MLGLIAALASLYVIYGTFGTALMVFKTAALHELTLIHLSGSWLGIATISANNIDYWFSSIWVVGVALIVYVFLSAISSTDYDLSGQ
jgi:beta-lactamase regulating signal transducer with metallopeptidase domain